LDASVFGTVHNIVDAGSQVEDPSEQCRLVCRSLLTQIDIVVVGVLVDVELRQHLLADLQISVVGLLCFALEFRLEILNVAVLRLKLV